MWQFYGQRRPDFAIVPGPGQESVWDYPRPPRMAADARRIRVLANGVLLAESVGAYRVLETASPPTFYLPPGDVRTGCLVAAAGRSYCEWKGEASYWGLADKSDQSVAWSYEQPKPAFEAIRGWFAFYPARVECYVDDERVRPQPGEFYGGWVTSELVGPFKGEPGTGDW